MASVAVSGVGLQAPFKEIELKAFGQDKNDQTRIIAPPISMKCPLPDLEQPGLLLPAPTRKGMWPTPYPTPTEALYTRNQPASTL